MKTLGRVELRRRLRVMLTSWLASVREAMVILRTTAPALVTMADVLSDAASVRATVRVAVVVVDSDAEMVRVTERDAVAVVDSIAVVACAIDRETAVVVDSDAETVRASARETVAVAVSDVEMVRDAERDALALVVSVVVSGFEMARASELLVVTLAPRLCATPRAQLAAPEIDAESECVTERESVVVVVNDGVTVTVYKTVLAVGFVPTQRRRR